MQIKCGNTYETYSQISISRSWWDFYTSSNYPKFKLICTSGIWTFKTVSNAKL